jgi:hypothetical protein
MALHYATLPFSVFKDEFRLADLITELQSMPMEPTMQPPPPHASTFGTRHRGIHASARNPRFSRDAQSFSPACTCNNDNDGPGKLTKSQRRSLCNAQEHAAPDPVVSPGTMSAVKSKRSRWWRKRATKGPRSVPAGSTVSMHTVLVS